ncbi:hypothetical protein AUEXF2481DRAFT_383967 [Aureobasidium subglaciale EXF-2481]|uniref:WW domain-containing protein n=1 Tax=Aureobasidium subglaciale (strain EXF-2481) TaxID=1043005 RepID=A0A074YM65_AURSE|nr:uncharacterized protein AUEXF2481DRAFT_383967 [Aureobasidium subglaciale EXF-2481]KAI5205521.1 hypothetical protein E4T38_04129 [Aureobasidium subglaciale]KAI5224472.1 hypothetical protein E4T40_04060 [Aureobasidium subglaciale]KAI5227713.1 hypothetical protein E4T41_04280 [Aureobasidium subglaciale]KAI5263270.1 hypothetical protein E4T46_03901 [Aureobasidium subglaciale]KEQ98918.1 hypothetical protein AUEXF2481DRAFT_383967 [Aureobasidium subglaciale EXF-2481]
MADYAPPPGPPPPQVPEGWKAQWNDQYKEWFFVNLYTKQSQWEKPTEPAYPSSGGAPPGAPPGYDSNHSQHMGAEKSGYGSNNPYGSSIHSGGSAHNVNDDEALARKLQAEEEARARQTGQSGTRTGASDNYYSSATPSQPQYSNDLPPRDQDRGKSKGGLLGKLLGKASSSSSRPNQGYGQQGYPSGGMMGGGGYGMPQQHYGGYPQQGYGGYPPQQMYGQPQRRTGGGLGGGAGMALGAGAGLLGGAMLMNGIDNMEDNAYEQGYDNGGGGDDYGGGDDGGGGDF